MPLTLLGGCLRRLQLFGHIPPHFSLDNLQQCDISHPQTGGVRNQGTADPAAARIELADAP